MLTEKPTMQTARKIHRIGGLLLAAFILFYTLTGLLLNHRSLFNYFIVKEKTISPVPISDPALLRSFIATYKQQIKRDDDPTVIRIREGKTIEFLYGSHGKTTYIIDPAQGTMERVDKSPHQPWAWLNRLHKAFKTGPGWLLLADVAAGTILLVTISGMVMVRYRALEIGLVVGGCLLFAVAAALA